MVSVLRATTSTCFRGEGRHGLTWWAVLALVSMPIPRMEGKHTEGAEVINVYYRVQHSLNWPPKRSFKCLQKEARMCSHKDRYAFLPLQSFAVLPTIQGAAQTCPLWVLPKALMSHSAWMLSLLPISEVPIYPLWCLKPVLQLVIQSIFSTAGCKLLQRWFLCVYIPCCQSAQGKCSKHNLYANR